MRAMDIAKNNNVKICLDLADPNMVKANKELLKSVIDEYADIVIANESEAKEFTGQEPEQAINTMSEKAEITIIKLGKEGSLIRSNNNVIKTPGFKANAIDTTGAGDCYTAGFLYGLLNDLDLETSGKIASFIASKVVEVKGARLDQIPKEEIDKIRNDR